MSLVSVSPHQKDQQGYLFDTPEETPSSILSPSSTVSLVTTVRLFLNKHLFYPFLSGSLSALTLYLRQRLFNRK